MGRSWGVLAALGVILGRLGAILGRLWGILVRSGAPNSARECEGAAVGRRRAAPPRDLLRKFLSFKGLEISRKTKDVHTGLSTRRAALGAADLERPAGGDRRPLAGMFRVRVVAGNCCRDV